MGDLSSEESQAEVQCFLPGNSQYVKHALLSPGSYCLPEIAEALGIPVPLVDLLPMNEESMETEHRIGDKILLRAKGRYKAILGAAPLIRFKVENEQSRPYLQEEGLWLLKNLCTPVYVAVFIGLGRCGKSTTCSALCRTSSVAKPDCFPSNNERKPVTNGADVAAIPSDNGSLLIIDCEGSDNAFTKKQQNCRILATFAFAFASHIIFCEGGDIIKETTIDELGAAVATGGLIRASREMILLPKICFLLLKCNLAKDLSKDECDEVFGDQEDEDRNGSRRDIRDISRGELEVRSLANFLIEGNKARYEEGIKGLHDYLCQSSASRADLHFTGTQLAEVLRYLCDEVARLGTFETESAYSSIIHGHLQMITKACINEYEKALPVREYYQDADELRKLESKWRLDALEKFDAKVQSISFHMKPEIRCDMEKQMDRICENKLMGPNARYRENDEKTATSIREAMAVAFGSRMENDGCSICVDECSTCVVSKQRLKTYETWQSENMTEFEAQTMELRCLSVIETARNQLNKDMTEQLETVRRNNEVLRLRRQAICMQRILTILVILLLFMGLLALLILNGVVSLHLGSQEPLDVSRQRLPEYNENATSTIATSRLEPGVVNVEPAHGASDTIEEPLSTTAAPTPPSPLTEELVADEWNSPNLTSNISWPAWTEQFDFARNISWSDWENPFTLASNISWPEWAKQFNLTSNISWPEWAKQFNLTSNISWPEWAKQFNLTSNISWPEWAKQSNLTSNIYWPEWAKPEEAPTALLSGVAGLMVLLIGGEWAR